MNPGMNNQSHYMQIAQIIKLMIFFPEKIAAFVLLCCWFCCMVRHGEDHTKERTLQVDEW